MSRKNRKLIFALSILCGFAWPIIFVALDLIQLDTEQLLMMQLILTIFMFHAFKEMI